MSETPLSDRIPDVAGDPSRTMEAFLEEFRRSRVGVIIEGAPLGRAGAFVATREQPVSLGTTEHGDGRPRLLAFADPVAYARRFGRPFNGEMYGDAVLATALHNPDCAGVLVNSALAETSVVIGRATAQALLRPADARPPKKPWWRFW